MYRASDKSGKFVYTSEKLSHVVEYFAIGRTNIASITNDGEDMGDASIMVLNAQVDAVYERMMDDEDRERECRIGRQFESDDGD